MIRWITDRLGTAPATSPEIEASYARLDVRDLVDKGGNSAEAVRRKIEEGAALLSSGARLIVCCDYGISRSNAVAAGIIAKVEGLPLSAAVELVIKGTGEQEIKLQPLAAVRAALGGTAGRSKSAGGSTVLVTGGSGFIAQALKSAIAPFTSSAHFVGSEIDLLAGPTKLALMVAEHGVDTIVHLANPRVYTSNRALGDMLTMARNVVDVCEFANARLIFLSSWEVYSGYQASELWADEATPYCPKGPYAEAKVLAETLLRGHRQRHGLHLNILRSSPVYGSGSDKPKFLYTFARAAMDDGATIRTHRYSNGEPALDLLHVDDLAAAITSVISQQPEGDFNFGGGRLWSTREIAELLVKVAETKVPVTAVPIEDSVSNVFMDSTRASRVLGWAPREGLESYLPRLVTGSAEGA